MTLLILYRTLKGTVKTQYGVKDSTNSQITRGQNSQHSGGRGRWILNSGPARATQTDPVSQEEEM